MIAFNTGRHYTRHGQRIAATRTGTDQVAMVDADRLIMVTLFVPGDAPAAQHEILEAYDRGWYSTGINDPALEAALFAAARAL